MGAVEETDITTNDNHYDMDSAGAASDINTWQEEPSDAAPLIADDMTRFVEIIAPDQKHHRFMMLIDSGNPQQNLISTAVLDVLGLPHGFRKRSRPRRRLRRILARLFPQSNSAKAVRSMEKIRNGDGSVFRGQDGSTVPISWYGHNRNDLRRPQVHFEPRRYRTTHLVVDSEHCPADVVLCWDEIDLLGLDRRVVNVLIPKPPTPVPDSDGKKYEGYERRRAANEAGREAEKARRRANGQG
ncbi:hypothetical protein SLS58_005849 [Diplodia intermedia]|uniref:Uncharacterized protein n=1 Tax=Diplodia intermedia TaxID=856260 RepID=A0ABR3TQB6_9PEZI